MLQPNRVFCARARQANYDGCEGVAAPELPSGRADTSALTTLRQLLHSAKLDSQNFGTPHWNPLGDIIKPRTRVLIKPNWVTHHNLSGAGMDCLITHSGVIEAIVIYALKARPAAIVIGDAPIQGCDFAALLDHSQLNEILARLDTGDTKLSVADFRCSILPGGRLESGAVKTSRTADQYVLFDLAEHSDLEPISDEAAQFRVTKYDPDALARTHRRGRHQYLIAREAIEADVVINVPKLKTHKKAGVTGALKNMVGINGHKEYLPHHRKGGSTRGGDCYPGGSRLKSLAEHAMDAANRTSRARLKQVLPKVSWLALTLGTFGGEDMNLEGSWHGNDTVWRMCLDLQRVLHYGRLDGGFGEQPQRTVLTITDAIISGEGNGPLAPTPVPLGLMTLGLNTAAIEWVHALLMGFDPERIPVVREAFAPHRYALADFGPSEIVIEADGSELSAPDFTVNYSRRFRPPDGWQGHCEANPPMSGRAG